MRHYYHTQSDEERDEDENTAYVSPDVYCLVVARAEALA